MVSVQVGILGNVPEDFQIEVEIIGISSWLNGSTLRWWYHGRLLSLGLAPKHLRDTSRALAVSTLTASFPSVVALSSFCLPEVSNRINGVIFEEKDRLVINLWKAKILNFREKALMLLWRKAWGHLCDEFICGPYNILMLFWRAARPNHWNKLFWESLFVLSQNMKNVVRSFDKLRVRIFFENEIKDFVLNDPIRESFQV
jgi:hypothetical protein